MSVALKWYGLAVWMTASKGGSEMTALSNARYRFRTLIHINAKVFIRLTYHLVERCPQQ